MHSSDDTIDNVMLNQMKIDKVVRREKRDSSYNVLRYE